MASGPITSWQIVGETMETWETIFLGSKITADGDCSHEIQRCLLLEIKAMTKQDSILKSRDITLLTNTRLVEAVVFPVVMYGCESWTIKKAECWRIDAFELWCWGRLLRVPWTARRSSQSILKEISPEYSLEGLKLKLQYLAIWYEELSHWKKPWCWEILKAGGEGDDGEWDGWMASWLDGCEFEQTPGVYDGQGSLMCCSRWGDKDWVTELNWTELFECKKTKQKCRYIQWIYSVQVFSCILLCSRFIYEIEVYAQMCPNVTDYYSYMNKNPVTNVIRFTEILLVEQSSSLLIPLLAVRLQRHCWLASQPSL